MWACESEDHNVESSEDYAGEKLPRFCVLKKIEEVGVYFLPDWKSGLTTHLILQSAARNRCLL